MSNTVIYVTMRDEPYVGQLVHVMGQLLRVNKYERAGASWRAALGPPDDSAPTFHRDKG